MPTPALLLVGASRGLGLALAAEFVRRGWRVTGTVRDTTGRTPLHDLAAAHPDAVAIEPLDVTDPGQIAALAQRLSGRAFDMLFVNSGVATGGDRTETFAQVSDAAFANTMAVNVLGVMRAVEGLAPMVRADGLVGVMSSGQGSVSGNTTGGADVYRASKAALNQAFRSYAARQPAGGRALVAMAPGWIRTDLGGPAAPLGPDEAIPQVVDTLIARQGHPGLAYLDRHGQPVAW